MEFDAEAVFAEIVAEREEKAKQAQAEPEIRGVQIGRLDGALLFRCFRWPTWQPGDRIGTVEIHAFGLHFWATFAVRRRTEFDKERFFFRRNMLADGASAAAVLLSGRRFTVTYYAGRRAKEFK